MLVILCNRHLKVEQKKKPMNDLLRKQRRGGKIETRTVRSRRKIIKEY